MSRVPRGALPAYGRFHLTVRGVNRCRIFLDEEDYRFFLRLFRRVMRKEELQVHAYCLMPNHWHAVVEGSMELISRAMHWLNGKYAREFNAGMTGAGICSRSASIRASSRTMTTSRMRASTCGTTRYAPDSASVPLTGPGAGGSSSVRG